MIINKGIKMVLRDLGATVLFVVILSAVAVGVGSQLVTKEDDHPIEEMAENVIESTLEELLGWEGDELDGVIDFTPDSKED